MNAAAKLEKLRRCVLGGQLDAAAHVRKVVRGEHADSHVPWNEVSGRTRAALLLTQGAMAAERAKTMSEAPKVFGMVIMQDRIEDQGQWERMAQETSARSAIEAVAVPVPKPSDPKETP